MVCLSSCSGRAGAFTCPRNTVGPPGGGLARHAITGLLGRGYLAQQFTVGANDEDGMLRRYVGNTLYNIYNKKACAQIHAHWTVAFAQVCCL